MEFCISIYPGPDLKKEIDHLRFHYDRKLIKEKYPYINIFGPVESFVNLKKLTADWVEFLKKRKRFRITTDVISLLKQEKTLFLNLNENGDMKDIFDFIGESVNLYEPINFFPHILIARNHTSEELEYFFEELKGYEFNNSFLAEQFEIRVRENKQWEIYSTINI